MAITSKGFNSQQVSEVDFSKILHGTGYGAAPSVVVTGFDVTTTAGTRAVSVSAGTAVVAGVVVYSTAAEVRNAVANSSGAARQDWLVLTVDWVDDEATIDIVAGGASLPPLTQNPGSSWQMPLAQLTIANGGTTVPSGNIITRKPTPRVQKFTTLSLTLSEIFANSSGVTIGSLALTDPGWAYRVEVDAKVRARSASGTPGGAMELIAKCNGTDFGRAVSPALAPAGAVGVPCHLTEAAPTQTGPCTIAIVAGPNGLPAPGSFEIYGASDLNQLIVKQTPV